MIEPPNTADAETPAKTTARSGATQTPAAVATAAALPVLPEAIRAKLKAAAEPPAAAVAVGPAPSPVSTAGAGGAVDVRAAPSVAPMQRLRGAMRGLGQRLPAVSAEALSREGKRMRIRVTAMARRFPGKSSLGKLSVPKISPELRDGLVKHGRRAGLNLGTTIDKIIRSAPASGTAVAANPVTTVVTTDISTVAVQRAVKQPSVFAPGHILTALLAGGIIHIATTFAITSLGSGSAFRQLRPVLPVNTMVVMPGQTPATQILPFLPPDMLYAMCRFDLSAGPLEIKALLPEAGWSLALYTRQGDNFYAAPGQSARPVPVSFVLSPVSDRLVNLTPGVRKSDVEINQVSSPDTEGLMVLRAPLKGVSFEATARAELKRAVCAPAVQR